MHLPAELEESLDQYPDGLGRRWSADLPRRLDAAAVRWDIDIGAPFEPGGVTSYVASARTRTGHELVYKITVPHEEAVGEAEALTAYDGDGAVRVLAYEAATYELLLERAVPGTDLWGVPDDGERLGIATDLMIRLWRPCNEDGIADMGVVAAQWGDITERRLATSDLPWETKPIERGIELLRSMPREPHDRVLVHGDFHPGNILSAQREPWLVIDPKPLLGDPAFEPVQLLTQIGGGIADPDAFPDIERRLGELATRVRQDADRIARWAIGRTAEWSMWSWAHGDAEGAAFAARWAGILDRIV